MNDTERVQLLMEQYNRSGDLWLEYEKAAHKALFAFLAVAAAMGAVWADIIVANKNTAWIIFLLTQVEFILGIFSMGAGAAQNVCIISSKALAKRINQLAKDGNAIFDTTRTGRREKNRLWSTPMIATYAIGLMMAAIFVLGIIFAAAAADESVATLVIFIGVLEVVAIAMFALRIASFSRRWRISRKVRVMIARWVRLVRSIVGTRRAT